MCNSRSQRALRAHVAALQACRRCPKMNPPPVLGGPVFSPVILVGQAPGVHEPRLKRPFAWTAGKTLFRWFEEHCGVTEEQFRARIYMAAVCRCFPGKNSAGGDRVPHRDEIANCAPWLEAECKLLKPRLVIPVGKLAIERFLPPQPLAESIGRTFQITVAGVATDCIPLPHPSGASPWHRMEPGLTLLRIALRTIGHHEAFESATGIGE